jgi:hypothetical protein
MTVAVVEVVMLVNHVAVGIAIMALDIVLLRLLLAEVTGHLHLVETDLLPRVQRHLTIQTTRTTGTLDPLRLVDIEMFLMQTPTVLAATIHP